MSYEAPRFTGLIEKASKIALKHGVLFNPETRTFKGADFNVARATIELDKWQQVQEVNRRREARQAY